MIEMREADQLQLAFGVELMQDVRERDRIRSARDRRDHAIARANQIVLTNEPANSVNHAGRAGQVGQVGWMSKRRPERRERTCLAYPTCPARPTRPKSGNFSRPKL